MSLEPHPYPYKMDESQCQHTVYCSKLIALSTRDQQRVRAVRRWEEEEGLSCNYILAVSSSSSSNPFTFTSNVHTHARCTPLTITRCLRLHAVLRGSIREIVPFAINADAVCFASAAAAANV